MFSSYFISYVYTQSYMTNLITHIYFKKGKNISGKACQVPLKDWKSSSS